MNITGTWKRVPVLKLFFMDNRFLLAAAAAVGIYFVLKPQGTQLPGTNGQMTISQQRNALIQWANSSTTDSDYTRRLAIEAFNEMTDAEIANTYTYVFDYVKRGRQLQQGTAFYYAMLAISEKYNLFT